MSTVYPFSALVGQDTMKLALILNAINPRLGGVLIRGEKGTAKSTAARGLAALLPPIDVVDGCRFACDPQPTAERCPECTPRAVARGSYTRAAAFVELPIGATEDRVLGTLDLERALAHGERSFEPGLLARANRGMLYVDEVNLLPDHLVDTLLDAAAMGSNSVEREGLSFKHPAAFVLVGTMNPEEGELRPQLLDRFALAVDVAGMPEPSARAEVVRRRIAFEADPGVFAERWHDAESAERARIVAARELLPRVNLADALLELIARICTEFEVDGLRADLVMYKASVTLAAYAGRTEVAPHDVRTAAQLALPHRRRRQPFDQPGLDQERLDQVLQESPPTDAEQAQQVFEVGPAPPLSAAALEAPAPSIRARSSARRRRGQRIPSTHGAHVRSVPLANALARSLDIAATLLAAAPHQLRRGRSRGRIRLTPDDARVKLRESRAPRCTLFVVDASGSMAAQRRMAAAKGAVQSLLLEAYQQRDEVGLIAFRGTRAELVLPPTNSAHLAAARLRDLPTGGRTPLAAALRLAYTTIESRLRRRASRASLIVLVSDGRANVGTDSEALAAAQALHASGAAALVVDTEDGLVRLGLARRLCEALHGQYVRLADLAMPLAAAVKLAQAATP